MSFDPLIISNIYTYVYDYEALEFSKTNLLLLAFSIMDNYIQNGNHLLEIMHVTRSHLISGRHDMFISRIYALKTYSNDLTQRS